MPTIGKEKKAAFNRLVRAAKAAESDEEALRLYEQAAELVMTDKLERKLSKLRRRLGVEDVAAASSSSSSSSSPALTQQSSDEENTNYNNNNDDDTGNEKKEEEEKEEVMTVQVEEGFHMRAETYNKLYPYQRAGVKWLWSIRGKGGILADDMGLGKTIQVSSFLSGIFLAEPKRAVLIVAPVSVLEQWRNELGVWAPDIRVGVFHGTSAKRRLASLRRVLKKGGVCLTTYGMVRNQVDVLSDVKRPWNFLILDEGHKIKNPDIQVSRNMRLVPASTRVILSGTPIQNKLREMWSLFDFVCEGRLLGDRETFKQEFEASICASTDIHATEKQRQRGLRTAEELRKLIAPFFLRREKSTLTEADTGEERHGDALGDVQKNDIIAWVHLSEQQLSLYRAFLDTDEVKEALNHTQSPLAAMTVLKKICDHPRLLTEEMKTVQSLRDLMPTGRGFAADTLMAESKKLQLLVTLVQRHIKTGHRTLVFSQSKKMLDVIEIVFGTLGISMQRIDGTVVGTGERQTRIDRFQTNKSINCFLLTTQTGGLGITLTAADRVVIFDPAWNPAVDNQAVDRAYRIGQTRNVVVYRFVTCGTIEEVIYRKQVHKNGLMKTATEDAHQQRYFSRRDLRRVFSLDDPYQSRTQIQLQRMHGKQTNLYPELEVELESLNKEAGVFGFSHHDMLFSQHDELKDVDDDVQEEVLASRKKLLASTPARARRRQRLDLLPGQRLQFDVDEDDEQKRGDGDDGDAAVNIPYATLTAPEHELRPAQRAQYRSFVAEFRALQDEEGQEWSALLAALRAIQICDNDKQLQATCVDLSRQLGLVAT